MKPFHELSAEEQAEQLARIAAFGAQFVRAVEALTPAVIAVGQQLAALYGALQSAGLIDADGNPEVLADGLAALEEDHV